MKKLSFAVAFAAMSLVSTGAFAQEVEETVEVVEAAQQEAVEIQVSELPEAVTKAIAANFSEHTAERAFTTSKDEKPAYLVVLAKGDAKEEVLFDAEGNVLEQ